MGSNLIAGGAAVGGDWVVTPSVTLQELATDNVDQTETDHRADLITQFVPALSVVEQGPRSQLFLSYAPIFSLDAAQSGQDRVDQNLLGNGRVDIFSELLSVNFNVFATQGSGSGSFASTGANNLVPLSDRTLNFGGTVGPHLRERFGDLATLDAFYTVSSSNTTGNDQAAPSGAVAASSLLEQDARIIVGSGDSFNRLTAQLYLEHVDGSGSGANNRFDNDSDLIKLEYHLSHEYSLIGYGGYQGIHYASSPISMGYDQHELVWSVGGKLAPNDFTSIQVSYARQSGSYAPQVNIKYDLSPRTHIYANYIVTIENQLQQNLASLQSLGGGELGAPINVTTGLPFNAVNNQLFGSQNVLYRDKLATLSLNRQFTRSSITFTAGDDRRQPLSGPPTPDDAWYGTVTYSRELTPSLRGYVDVGYSRRVFSQVALLQQENDRLLNSDLSLSYQVSQTVTATATYSFFKRNSNVSGLTSTSNQFLVGIRKVF